MTAFSWGCQFCGKTFHVHHEVIEHKLDHVIEGITKLTTDQEHLDADVQALGTALSTIADEIAALKSQPGAPALDFSALDAAVAQAQGLATPPAPSAPADGSGDGTTATA